MNFKRLLFTGVSMLAILLVFQFIRIDMIGVGQLTNDQNTVAELQTNDNFVLDTTNPYMVLFDSKDETSIQLKQNFVGLFEFYKIQYEVIDVEYQAQPSFAQQAPMVISCVKNLAHIENLNTLFDYVNAGGTLVQGLFPETNGTYASYSAYFGIYETGDFLARVGLVCKKGLFFLSENQEYQYPEEQNYAHYVTLGENCSVMMTSADHTPLLWKVQRENGNIYTFNTTAILQKESRGILTGLLSDAQDVFLYPVANTFVTILEGYAFPTSTQISQIIRNKYQIDYRTFVNNVLQNKALELQKKYGVVYTATYLNSFNDSTKAPFANDGITRNDLVGSMSQILKSGGEMAMCGYNYKPFGLESDFEKEGWFSPFLSMNDILLSFQQSRNLSKSVFDSYDIRTYVPPAAQISDSALDMIQKDTEIQTVVGAYDKAWKYELQQEFGEQDGLYAFPKITRATQPQTPMEFSVVSSLQSFGIVSLDINMIELLFNDIDIYDTFNRFSGVLKMVNDQYGYVSYQTVSSVVQQVNQMDQMQINQIKSDQSMVVQTNYFAENTQFILRSKVEISSATGCSYKPIDNGVYLIVAQNPDFSIEFAPTAF